MSRIVGVALSSVQVALHAVHAALQPVQAAVPGCSQGLLHKNHVAAEDDAAAVQKDLVALAAYPIANEPPPLAHTVKLGPQLLGDEGVGVGAEGAQVGDIRLGAEEELPRSEVTAGNWAPVPQVVGGCQRLCPQGLGQAAVRQHGAHLVQQGPVEPLRRTVLFWRVADARLVLDALACEEGVQALVHVLAAVV